MMVQEGLMTFGCSGHSLDYFRDPACYIKIVIETQELLMMSEFNPQNPF
jgi:hypothetical protein